jgi:hypothetical protein
MPKPEWDVSTHGPVPDGQRASYDAINEPPKPSTATKRAQSRAAKQDEQAAKAAEAAAKEQADAEAAAAAAEEAAAADAAKAGTSA